MARRGRNYQGNQQNQNNNNNRGNYIQNGRNQNNNRNNNGNSNGSGNDNSNFRGNRGGNRRNSRSYQVKRRYSNDDDSRKDSNGNSRNASRNQDDSGRYSKKQKWIDKQQETKEEYEKKHGNNALITTLRDRGELLLRTHPNRKAENLFASENETALVPVLAPPKFGFEKDWTQDDFLGRFVSSAISLQALNHRVVNLPESEQYAILKFMFTSDGPIPVGSKKYSPSGAFQYSNFLNDLLQGHDRLGKMIAYIFYTENTFWFHDLMELVNFVMTTPTESLNHVRKIVLSSPVIRRAPGARDNSQGYRTPEDLDVEHALHLMPGLETLCVLLGYDINDQHFRLMMGQDWCGNHPNVPDLQYARRVSHTMVNAGAIDVSAVETDDAMFFAAADMGLRRIRQRKIANMDLS